MKSVMVSIKPKWCELIASGKKTIEVRKTRPKIETPFKCYIYCTKDKGILFWTGKQYAYADDRSHNLFDVCGNGKVIGEFVCDTFITDKTGGRDALFNAAACINELEAASYSQNKPLYGWRISDLVIYDKPKDLSEFWNADKCPYVSRNGCTYKYHCFRAGETKRCGQEIERPPQSWCYVEEIKNDD